MEIDNQSVKRILQEEFCKNILTIQQVRNLPSRNTYIVKDSNTPFVYKIYNRQGQEDEILNSIPIQEYLKGVNFTLPKIISTTSDKPYFLNQDYIVTLQEYIEGEKITLTEENVLSVGKLLDSLQRISYNNETIVHGDFILNNIIKTKEGNLYLIDWDYAHLGDSQEDIEYFIESEIIESNLPLEIQKHLKISFLNQVRDSNN